MPSSQTRTVAARVLTPIGWLQGHFTLPRLHAFVDFIDHAGAFLKLEQVRLPGRRDLVPVFVMQRDAAMPIVPGDARDLERFPRAKSREAQHPISCLLQQGVVHGNLVTLAGVPIRSFLLHHAGFVVVRDAVIRFGGGSRTVARLPRVLVNAAHVIGVSEERVRPAVRAARR